MQEWEKRDAIQKLADKLVKDGQASQAELDKIKQETIKEVADAVTFAKESPSPRPEDVSSYLFMS
jgi:pyruvate dehydrogenase E1 component alpha subunit